MSALSMARRARVAMLWSRHFEARALGCSAVSQALAEGSGLAEALGRIALGITAVKAGEVEPGLADLRRARALCAGLTDPDPVLVSYINLGCGLRLAGRLDEAVAVNLEGYELACATDDVDRRGGLLLANAAEAEFALGHWDRAQTLAQQAIQRSADELAWLAGYRIIGKIAAMRAHDVVGLLPHAPTGIAAAIPVRPAEARCRHLADAERALWAGRADVARQRLRDVWSSIVDTGEATLSGQLLALRLRAETEPQIVAELLQHTARLAPLPEQQAFARQCQAEATGHRDAWQASVCGWDRLGRPYEAAYCRWRWAEALLLSRADPALARTVLVEAAETATGLGAIALHQQIQALARLHRVPMTALAASPSPSAEAQFGLTPREREVLACITAGWSNRQIGQQLYISPKTVSVHISSILRKLDVANRCEAAGIARRIGLLAQPPLSRG
ncbi:response regulator transcription factor [Allorhizocola rhizosphaerae]|uniref:response regulator transcription factor n=1 Tax=Allorhizocola rhizosphaerae TaxID=1872709 RepID=UPI0013C304B7|nr:response regulator transcription factor [Allorhizocola rhizosphaerae]